jgi:hypothetical protein
MNTVSWHQQMLEQGVDLGAIRAELGNLSTPGAADFRPENWDEPTSNYQVAAGDTLSALAALYLDNAGRWDELWAYQRDERRVGGSPDQIYAGEWLVMPPEALANAKIMMGGSGGTSGEGSGRGPTNGNGTPAQKSNTTAIVVGVGALAALGLLYLATR